MTGRTDDPVPTQAATDEALLARFAAGDDAALASLAGRYEALLLALARGLVGGREDLARDAVQDAWVRVIRFARRFDGRSSARTWIYRIVINRCSEVRAREETRKKRERRRATVEPARDGESETSTEDVLGARIRAAIQGLDPSRRLILLLCYHQGLTHPQVAEVLQIPLGTLKSRLYASLHELRSRLECDGFHARTKKTPDGPCAPASEVDA